MERNQRVATGIQTSPCISAVAGDSLRRRFVAGAFWSLFGAVVSRGLTLGASVLAGRLLGSTGFGEVGMIQSTQGLFGVLAGAGLGLAATKHVAEYRAADGPRAARCVALITRIAVVTGLAASALLLVLSHWLAGSVLQAPHLAGELQVATGLVFLGALNGVQTGALAGLGDFRIIAFLSIVRGAVLCAALVVGIWCGGVMGGVIGLVLTEGVACAGNHLALRRCYPDIWAEGRGGRSDWSEFASLWRFSLLALLSSLATMPALWLSNVMLVSQPDGYSALGIFNAAERWRQLLLFLPAAVSASILSMLSNLHGKNDAGGFRHVVGMNLLLSAGSVLVPAAGLVVFSRLAMGLFGADYQDGWLTLIILAGSAVAVVFNNLLGQILVSRGAIWWRFLLDVLLAAVLALVSWQLIPVYRENGLALGHLIAYSATALALLVPVWYCLRKSPSQV
jgi:O-antigen/teichoic acid export membrane protein